MRITAETASTERSLRMGVLLSLGWVTKCGARHLPDAPGMSPDRRVLRRKQLTKMRRRSGQILAEFAWIFSGWLKKLHHIAAWKLLERGAKYIRKVGILGIPPQG